MFEKITVSEFVSTIETVNGEKLLEIRTWAKGNLHLKEIEEKMQRHRAVKGMDNTLADAQAKKDFAEFYLFRTEKEIEKRKMTIAKNEINVKENHGIIQQGSGNTASQNLSSKEKPKRWFNQPLFVAVVVAILGLLIWWIEQPSKKEIPTSQTTNEKQK